MELVRALPDAVRMAHSRKPAWRRTYLRSWREHAGKTLEAVAEKMGITHGQLSKIERGIYPYNQRVLEVAAEEYDCTVQDFLTRHPTEDENLFSLWGDLDESQKRRAARVLRAMDEEQ